MRVGAEIFFNKGTWGYFVESLLKNSDKSEVTVDEVTCWTLFISCIDVSCKLKRKTKMFLFC